MLAGTHPISLEKDPVKAARFAENLQKALDEESSEIRQQEFELVGTPINVWVQWGDNSFDQQPVAATLDKLGRVYLPIETLGQNQKKKLKGLALTGDKAAVSRIKTTELRYEGSTVKFLVCTLEA